MSATNKIILAKQILHNIVIPALDTLGMNSKAAQELVIGTGIQESLLVHRTQIGNGPALGLWQMEPATFWDIWNNYINYHAEIRGPMNKILNGASPSSKLLAANDMFAAAMCRVHYRRIIKPLPKAGDVRGHAEYWKRYYNTTLGSGDPDEFVAKWGQYITNDTWELTPGTMLA